MKERILTGWNFQRAFYLIAGAAIVVISFIDKQWMGVALGGYFASMGLFAFGCASRACFGKSCCAEAEPDSKNVKA